VIRVLRRYDPALARAAATRIYGPPVTVVAPPSTQIASLDWPPPPARPVVLGPWRETAAVRADATAIAAPIAAPTLQSTNSP